MMKYFRNNNFVYDLEKEISSLKSKAENMINEYCNNFYDNEMVDGDKVEEKRKELLSSINIKYDFCRQDSLYYEKGDFYICIPNKELDIREERRYGKLIKQADTIEELCDAFVYVTDIKRQIVTQYKEQCIYFFEGEKPIAYYGAIWTEKGLIYVAKMNDKGELELL